ncbi:hypothetical protein C6P45_002343 [Maudiozyma exigua]|uniref:WAC domain-containing protein n=1 Tax=Maudiozyma exigua TaxID=34358 RepID=A0A9P6WFG5_MAUEX|nr:hypothetical protein C6P45_002343 [Kazachstania exigua]
MVLYKRKPIILPDPLPLPQDLNIFVWHIDETGEWFYTYEEYLKRLDFYMKHHFTCEITGASCLTFFQALDSEEAQFKYVEEKFPLKLREPVARFLHFNVIKRLDALVEQVYARFKNDYFPGEVVYLRRPKDTPETNNESDAKTASTSQQPQYQSPYIVKEKAQFNATVDPETGAITVPGHCKYMLIEDDARLYQNGQQNIPYGKLPTGKSIIVDQSQIYRDRSTFTKHLIKCFFKITLHKASSKSGAPWSVKPEYLSMYGLTMNWPPELIQYKDNEPNEGLSASEEPGDYANEDDKMKKGRNKRKKEDDSLSDNENETSSKRNKHEDDNDDAVGDMSMSDVKIEETVEQVPVVTSITEDLQLPYKKPEDSFFGNLQYYNNNLETVVVSTTKTEPTDNLHQFGRILQVFQFLNSFGEYILLSSFNLDQFITSLKCTDEYEMMGEVVKVSLKKNEIKNKDPQSNHGSDSEESAHEDEEESDEESDPISDWKRNSKIRRMIESKASDADEPLVYKIVKNDPASDDIIDNISNNGCAIIVEAFVCLLSLFINEKGEWSTIIAEDWYDMPDDTTKVDSANELKTEKGEFKTENNSPIDVEIKSDESDNENSEEEERIEKCLNFRSVHWSERLTKRQFSNHFWLIILLGIFQDSLSMPKYVKFIKHFTEVIIPDEISSTHLPKQLWRNFCRNLSFEEKIESLWILVDMVTNYSPDIKQAVDDSSEILNQIRSEKFRITREMKAVMVDLAKLNPETDQEPCKKLQEKIDSFQKDKTFLETQILETDLQRVKPLGMDRYGNRYYWLSRSGVPVKIYSEEEMNGDMTDITYSTGRLFIQGPSRDMAKFLLKISDDELNRWQSICRENGREQATKEVFHIYRRPDGSIWQKQPGVDTEEIEIMSKEGKPLSVTDLSPLQKMALDEFPEYLSLDEDTWYCTGNVDDLGTMLNRLDTWGRREHDLLKQFKNTTLDIENTMLVRNMVLNPPEFGDEENKLLEDLNENALTTEELQIDGPTEKTDNDNNEHTDRTKNNEERMDVIEVRLDEIADEIMNLEDSFKTRKILNQIEELEKERDELQEEKEKLMNSQRPGGRIMARNERKRNAISRDNKLSNQTELLTDLINFRHFKAMENVIAWKNKIAIKRYGTELRKSTSSKKNHAMRDLVPTLDERMGKILKQLQSTTETAK